MVDSNYTSDRCLWRGRQVEVKSRQHRVADYLGLNPCPTTVACALSLRLCHWKSQRYHASGLWESQ